MPYGLTPECILCKASSSVLWKKNEKGDTLCNDCMIQGANSNIEDVKEASSNSQDGNSNDNSAQCQVVLRKSTRTRTNKQRVQAQAKSNTKGKGRRIIFKKSATKAPTAVATPVTTDSVFYKGSYFQVGDVISVLDVEGNVYYAQIRGLLQDQYCEKSAVITWLLPTDTSPKDRFDPATFILGPEEEVPRRLECMEFVCHAPSEYFKARNSPYPTLPQKPELCYIWTRLKPHIKPIRREDDIFANPY